LLLIPLAVSASIWPISSHIFAHTVGADAAEGAFYEVWFFSALLFVTSPMLGFQAIEVGGSVMDLFLRGPWTIHNLHQFMIEAAILASCIYASFAAILYPLARRSIARALIGSVCLLAGMLAVMMVAVSDPLAMPHV
jgi:hypothetical protein